MFTPQTIKNAFRLRVNIIYTLFFVRQKSPQKIIDLVN